MPGDKPGTVAQQLTPDQVLEVVAWVRVTPNAFVGTALLEKLQSLGVECGLGAAYTFRDKHITPALKRIRDAREFAEKLKTELTEEQGTIARGADMMAQQMVFDWMLKASNAGPDVLTDVDMQKQLRRLYVIVSEGMNAKDRATTTEARAAASEARVKILEATLERLKSETLETIKDASLGDAEREARIRELFGK